MDIATQYDSFSSVYSQRFAEHDAKSRAKFYALLPELRGKRMLDIGCGDGSDVAHYTSIGALAEGIDPSDENLRIARSKAPNAVFHLGVGEHLPHPDQSIDVVTSIYALQTSPDVPRILSEAARVLKPGGTLLYLTKHPIRQHIEKQAAKADADYFTQEVVRSTIFGGSIPLSEPSHTLEEYLSPAFLAEFELQHFEEGSDFPASDRVGASNYPCYMIVTAVRR